MRNIVYVFEGGIEQIQVPAPVLTGVYGVRCCHGELTLTKGGVDFAEVYIHSGTMEPVLRTLNKIVLTQDAMFLGIHVIRNFAHYAGYDCAYFPFLRKEDSE